jgi:hypothetical protein
MQYIYIYVYLCAWCIDCAAVCIGYTATDMTGGKGRSAEEGARTPYMLACKLANDDKTGGFWVDEREAQW